MPNDPTTNYSWNLPNVGSDDGSWGGLLNTILDDQDGIIFTISGVANAALPKAGGTMTGNIGVKTESYTPVNKGSMTGAVSFDLSAGNFFYGTLTGAMTPSFSNVPASGNVAYIMLEITNGGAFTISWPAAIKWAGGSNPTLQSSGLDVIVLYTRDGGTTWRGALAIGNSF